MEGNVGEFRREYMGIKVVLKVKMPQGGEVYAQKTELFCGIRSKKLRNFAVLGVFFHFFKLR